MPKKMLDLSSIQHLDLTKDLDAIKAEMDAMQKPYLTTPEFAELIGFHEQTLRYWDKTGKFRPHHKTPGGTRMYSLEQIKDLQEIFAADGIYNRPENRRKYSKSETYREQPDTSVDKTACEPGEQTASGEHTQEPETSCGPDEQTALETSNPDTPGLSE